MGVYGPFVGPRCTLKIVDKKPEKKKAKSETIKYGKRVLHCSRNLQLES